MKTKIKEALAAALILGLMATSGCGSESRVDSAVPAPSPAGVEQTPQAAAASGQADYGKVLVTTRLDIDFSRHLVTFIELGADRCIPCKAMQPIMKEIAAEFAGKIQVVFYDVWKDPEPAQKYRIQLIPTQVFMDQKGNEIFRHVGFFSKEEILKMLKEKGVL